MRNRIPDEVVLSPDFIEKLEGLVVVVRPFVHWFVTLPATVLDLENQADRTFW